MKASGGGALNKTQPQNSNLAAASFLEREKLLIGLKLLPPVFERTANTYKKEGGSFSLYSLFSSSEKPAADKNAFCGWVLFRPMRLSLLVMVPALACPPKPE